MVKGWRSIGVPLALVLVLVLPALLFLGSLARTSASGGLGRSAHEHTVVLYATEDGSAKSHAHLAPRPTASASPSSAPPVVGGTAPPPPASSVGADVGGVPGFLQPGGSQLVFNQHAVRHLSSSPPSHGPTPTTLHFTFGSAVMIDFVKNWLHFARKAGLSPVLVGAADGGLLSFCDETRVPAAAISPELDVWTYKRKQRAAQAVYEIKSEWKYFRHHNSDFLEMGLVKASIRVF